MINEYLIRLTEISDRGDAREESYYSTLENFLIEYNARSGQRKIEITTIPKKTDAGNPDFRIWDGNQHITGYIEAKDPGVEDLDSIENSDQLKRYRETFPNLILTNFLEFRLYRQGERVERTTIGKPFVFNKLKIVPPVENEGALFRLLDNFFPSHYLRYAMRKS